MLYIEDLNTHMYPEIIDTITRDEESLVQDAIDAAVGEATSYLERFDTDNLLNQEDSDRDKTLLMYLKDITVWHLLAVANPDTDLDFRESRYKMAIKWLEKIQGGKVTPKDWVLSSVETANDPFFVSSDTKRETSF